MKRFYHFPTFSSYYHLFIKQSVVIFMFTFSITFLSAQVRTTILEEGQKLSSQMPGYTADQPETIVLPKVDVRKILEQDREKNIKLPRFGIKIPVHFSVQDGQWYEMGRTSIWKMKFYSLHATALSFQFTDLHLPEGSEMWLYSEARNMVMGPILPEYVHNGILPTDQIFGEEVTVAVIMSGESKDKFSITVGNVIHGIKKAELEVRSYGDSNGDCENNVNCPLGNGWDKEKDAVCLTFVGSSYHCTGVLINNSCRDLTPYILTAKHCTDSPYNNYGNWVFRFNYDSPSTTCHGDQGEPSTWISFYGAYLVASWENTDFSLLRLYNSIIGNTEITLAGWDRSSGVPNSSIIIHHPEGDVKKITVDNSASVIENSPPLDSPYQPGTSFRLTISNGQNGDDGIVEGGSSGSPQFNSYKRIVGIHGGTIGEQECDSTFYALDGRIYNSWTGGGTNTSRLSNWLGGNGNPTTTNTIRVPGLTGDYSICDNNNHTYQLLNPIPGKSVSWSVSPGGLFASSTSGTGTPATLKKSSSAHGKATLTFTLSENGCDPVILTRDITVGIPDYMELDIQDNLGNKVLKTCETVFGETVYSGGDAGILEYEWDLISSSGSWYIESTSSALVPYREVEIDYSHPNPLPSTETVRIRARNACGWSWQQETYWTVEDHCSLLVEEDNGNEIRDLTNRVEVAPNVRLRPTLAQSEVHIDWKNGYEGGGFQVSIMDRNGRLVKKSDHMEGERGVMQITGLSAGMYFMRIMYKDTILWKRFIVIK